MIRILRSSMIQHLPTSLALSPAPLPITYYPPALPTFCNSSNILNPFLHQWLCKCSLTSLIDTAMEVLCVSLPVPSNLCSKVPSHFSKTSLFNIAIPPPTHTPTGQTPFHSIFFLLHLSPSNIPCNYFVDSLFLLATM